MEVNEYIESLISDVQADADALQKSSEEAFMENILEKLKENETITDYIIGYFKNRGRHNRIIEFNGYSYEDSDGTYNFFVVDDLLDNDKDLNNQLINTMIKQVEEFVACAFEEKHKEWEESSYGFEAASQLLTLFNNKRNANTDYDLKRVRIYIMTTKSLSKRFKNVKREEINGIPIEFSVFDAIKLYEMAKSGFEKEPVDINFSNYGIKEGLSVLECTSVENQFDSYLATVPGDVLANIYLEHGAQVLEGNVRSFLSVRGKVNKSIRKTILSEPEKFFILNNGITVTGNDLKINNETKRIEEIYNLQIVNGGQTTASLANAIIKEKADLSKVRVMMKLSIIRNKELYEEMVPEISRASNSQNKVSEADFFSNHPFHVKIEELSKKILAPAVDGNQYQTVWFYERARGQYTVAQMKLTKSQAKAFQLKNPKSQVIKKTDLAKYIMSYDGFPHETSKGAQSVMKRFSRIIQGTDKEEGLWESRSSEINELYFKDSISKGIIFKELEKLVSRQGWYKEVKAYRANIVTYSIAVLTHFAKENKLSIDLDRIWREQHIYPELEKQLIITTKEVYDFLTGERETENVTEWAKKEKCWTNAKKVHWTISKEFEDSLVEKKKEKKSDVNEATVDSMKFVLEKDSKFWLESKTWGKKFLYLTSKEEGLLDLASKIQSHGRIPSDKQFKEIVRIYNKLVSMGMTKV